MWVFTDDTSAALSVGGEGTDFHSREAGIEDFSVVKGSALPVTVEHRW
jgi:hypothetical protein